MGQQTSQLDHGDGDGVDGGSSRSQSPMERLRAAPTRRSGLEEGSPQPFGHDGALSQDFTFSSQVPLSPAGNRKLSKLSHRKPRSRFERSSESPESAAPKTEPNAEEEARPGMEALAPRPPKKKRSRKKKQSLTLDHGDDHVLAGASHHDHNMAAIIHSPDGIRLLEPRSSMDLDAVPSSLAGESPQGTNGEMNTEAPNDEFAAVDEEELHRQEKRQRKERRKAKKAARQAEQLRASLLAANPSLGAHDDPEALSQAREMYLQNDDIEQKQFESRVSNQQVRSDTERSRDLQRFETITAAHQTDGNDQDTQMDDPNQLPTPDEESLPNLHHGNTGVIPDVTADSVDVAESTIQPAHRKRKARDSDKKSRKRRKDQSQSLQGTPTVPDAAAETNNDNASSLGDVGSPTRQSSQGETVKGSTKLINDISREFYSQRYASNNSTPLGAHTAAISNQKVDNGGVSLSLIDESPSAARLQRQAISTRSSSERHLVKEEERDGGLNESVKSMDVDRAVDYADSTADMSMADNDGMLGAQVDDDAESQYGSDDLGINPATEHDEKEEVASVIPDSTFSPSTRQIPESPMLPATGTKTKSLRQYGARASTGRKRIAKSSYVDRAEQSNGESFAELPSPTITAKSVKARQRAGRTSTVPVVAGPSSASQDREKETKIISRMTDGSGQPPQALNRPSGTPAPTFTRTLPKKVTKLKNPKPEDEATGPFTGNELRNLKEAIEQWRKDHDMTDHEIKEMVQKNPQLAKTNEFWDYVHYACPKRKRQKIINQVRKTHHNFVARATWTKEQHDELAAHYEVHGKNYKLLGQLINRHPDDVRDRVRNYVVCGDSRKADVWTHEEEERLVGIIHEAFNKIRELRDDERPDLQERNDEDLVDWTVVSENMGWTRSRLQCRAKWKQLRMRMEGGNIDGKAGHSMEEIIQNARDTYRTMSHKDLFLIAKAIKKSGTNADSRIGWHKLREKWYAMEKWNRPALMLAWHRLRRSVPDWRLLAVPEIAKYHMDYYDQTKEINVLPEDQLDLAAEYREMEHKISKIIKSAANPKTPYFAVNGDEDEVDPQASADQGDNASHGKLDVPDSDEDISNIPKYERQTDEADESDSQPQTKPKSEQRRSIHKIHPEVEQSGYHVSKSSHLPKTGRDSGRGTVPSRSQPGKPRKGKLVKQPISAEKVVESDVSSDTDADDVEDIPAILPD